MIREIMLKERDRVLRTIRVFSGGTMLRTKVQAQGICVVITKDGKDHWTVLTNDEALRLSMMLTEQAMMNIGGRVFN